ncbi:hypothetical protein CEN44_11130 [Fischerella muscicola CCMEE 5323]|uniref:Uncharacterized protein n=2 Tax=Hapalosiphonaceae TaxID=1892263 RepID=A0A2N6K3K7_FISMU|nr:hypothetical protein CEN44_11130 [Fischerella muscicola CCMEE 5323]
MRERSHDFSLGDRLSLSITCKPFEQIILTVCGLVRLKIIMLQAKIYGFFQKSNIISIIIVSFKELLTQQIQQFMSLIAILNH